MSSDVCCKSLKRGDASPFELVVLGWYDGLTSGMARCRSCGATHHVEMVAWDRDQHVRVYALAEVTRASYDAVCALHRAPVAPEHAIDRADALALATRDALAMAHERTLYVAATDLAKTIVAARRIELAQWKDVLGF